MFPGETPERIAKALEIGHDLSGAVDYLLGDNDSAVSILYHVMYLCDVAVTMFGLDLRPGFKP